MSVASNGRCVTVGTFDGVHLGHIKVIDKLLEISRERGLSPLAVTFSEHPLEVIAPGRAPGRIMPAADEKVLLERLGVEVEMLDFNREMMLTTARNWMLRLKQKYNARVLIMGYDNTFGSDGRQLSLADYMGIGSELGLEVIVVDELPGISSSAVRKAILKGDIESVTAMLGRPYRIEGTVVEGDRIGRTIGFPTANIKFSPRQLVPANGVYAANVKIGNETVWRRSVINIGVRPTINDTQEERFEVHILDYTGNLYGGKMEIEFLQKLRDERRFGSLDQLKEAISSDCLRASSL